MSRKIVLALLIGVFFISCKKQQTPKQELLSIITKLQNDKDYSFFKTLEPTKNDIKNITKDSVITELIYKYSKSRWALVDEMPKNMMLLNDKTDKIAIVASTKLQLVEWRHTKGVPQNYSMLHEFIKDNVVVYGVQYIDLDGKLVKTRDAFFKVNNKWIFIPQTYKAFF